jgi:hypothetical protein
MNQSEQTSVGAPYGKVTRCLRRDDCGDWAIIGHDVTIYPDGAGYLLCITTGQSARRWGFIKKRLAFCQATQDGDEEGALHLDRLPTLQEADVIREALGIRKRKHLSDETIASLRDRLPTAEKRLVRLISSRARERNGP